LACDVNSEAAANFIKPRRHAKGREENPRLPNLGNRFWISGCFFSCISRFSRAT